MILLSLRKLHIVKQPVGIRQHFFLDGIGVFPRDLAQLVANLGNHPDVFADLSSDYAVHSLVIKSRRGMFVHPHAKVAVVVEPALVQFLLASLAHFGRNAFHEHGIGNRKPRRDKGGLRLCLRKSVRHLVANGVLLRLDALGFRNFLRLVNLRVNHRLDTALDVLARLATQEAGCHILHL